MKINFIIIQNFFLVDFFFEKKNYSQHVPRFFKDVLRIILKKIGKSEDFCLFLICFFSDPFPDRFFFFSECHFFLIFYTIRALSLLKRKKKINNLFHA